MPEKVKICRVVNDSESHDGHLHMCTNADWHPRAGLMLHSCECGHSWRDAA